MVPGFPLLPLPKQCPHPNIILHQVGIRAGCQAVGADQGEEDGFGGSRGGLEGVDCLLNLALCPFFCHLAR
jgi:hypothetical protein